MLDLILIIGPKDPSPIPFQQLSTGTGCPDTIAFLDAPARKYGNVEVAASCPSWSLKAKVS